MRNSSSKKMYNRILFCVLAIFIAFFVLFIRLFIVQVVQADELSQKQMTYMFENISLSAARGNIYDRDMNVLVQDADCYKVYIHPNDIENDKEVAEFLSSKLSLSYETVYEKVSDKSSSYVVIKNKVDNTTALEIASVDYDGVEIEEDHIRIYSDPEFAQYVLGFTGADHTGLYGVEATFNDVLSGEDGIKTVLFDSNRLVVESSSTVKKSSKKGDSLVLTLDSVVQYYAESAVQQAQMKYSPKRAMAIVTDVNTGAILGMAASPSYSLDDPWEVNEEFYENFFEGGDYTISQQQLEMWNNPFVSFIYEPGSTFKVITTSGALEEHVVNLDTNFYCSGSIEVAGITINCNVYPYSHGSENLVDAMANSCNPALVKIANLMGVDKFYNYIYNYGFGEKTGIQLDGEESGILSSNQNVNPVDFATLAFGQGLGVTPVQMIQALNAAINGGYLITPRIAEQIIDSETGELVYEYEPQVVRQVISEETSEIVRGILNEVVNRMSILDEYSDYGMMGKTGTAQKYVNGTYQSGKYVTSFYGAVPYDDPQISVIVILDEPSGYGVYGSNTAAPIGAELLASSYDYLITKNKLQVEVSANSRIIIPDVRGKSIEEAKSILDGLKIEYTVSGDATGYVTNQDLISVEYTQGTKVNLSVSSVDEDNYVIVPNVYGMSVQKANEILTSGGLVMNAIGGGIALNQDIDYGTSVERGTIVTVTFEYAE